MEIFVNTLTSKCIAIHAYPSDTVADVKQLIWESEGIPAELQKLIFGGKHLEDNRVISDYKIMKESTLHLLVHSTEGMKITVETDTDQTLTLEVEPFDTVKSVKHKIQEKQGIPTDQQRITFKTLDLHDSRILSDYNIQNESSLNLELRPAGSSTGEEMEIFVKTLTGKTITIKVKSSNTVETLKEKIQSSQGMPPNRQKLIFGARELKDGTTLSEYSLSNWSTVHVVLHGESIY